eukprot:TRINITY_DN15487_c0_g1_i1.p1 TRINITY_DN15487_c0_g1~~TRINITY_DN15487_c0_g1_i1.p1  ORF type:complete len:408 (+),score=42.57 TRINITY_DN15487_c0_g1_i1:196-1419(+)
MFGQTSLLQSTVCKKTIVITGSSDGIGAHLAKRLAALGANIILVARCPEKLKVVGDAIRANGGVAHAYIANLSQEEECERVIQEILADHEVIDIFVSNAGRSIRRSVEHQATDRFHDFQRLMALNYFGAMKLILGVLPSMRARGAGHIVHVSSFGVPMRQPRFAGYVASKSALDAALQSIAAEVRTQGVRTSSVYMPLVQTKMVSDELEHLSLLHLDEACALIERAMITKEQEVMDVPSRFIAFIYFFFPCVVTFIMSLVYQSERERPPDEQSPASPKKKPRASRSLLYLRMLGNFLWLVRMAEPVLRIVLYSTLFPLMGIVFAAFSTWRELSALFGVLGPLLRRPSVQAPVCILTVAMAWTSRPISAIWMACANVMLSLFCSASSGDALMSCRAESCGGECTSESR